MAAICPYISGRREVHGNEEEIDINVCSTAVPVGVARCHAHERTDARAKAARPARAGQAHPAGTLGNGGAYDPGYLQSAYNLAAVASTGGGGQVVGIVDAFDDPNAEQDLANYRSWFGLPPCTTANGCFRKLNQFGRAGPYPMTDVGWAEEISLDLDMARDGVADHGWHQRGGADRRIHLRARGQRNLDDPAGLVSLRPPVFAQRRRLRE